MTSVHAEITRTYAEWTALSSLRSGSPVKSGARIYPALRRVAFDQLFALSSGPIAHDEFAEWHVAAVQALMKELGVGAGWAAKLVNVYLKTRAYIARAGRPGLLAHVHPPVDGGLWRGIEKCFGRNSAVCRLTHGQTRIKDIETYEQYCTIIDGCRLAATELKCSLIEVEQLWRVDDAGSECEMPGATAIGCSVILWDEELAGEVAGTIVGYTAPEQWCVRLGDADGTEIHLGAGAQSRIGRWHVTRAADGTFVLPDSYRRRNPHQESASFGQWLGDRASHAFHENTRVQSPEGLKER